MLQICPGASGILTPLPGYRDSRSILRNFRIYQETIRVEYLFSFVERL